MRTIAFLLLSVSALPIVWANAARADDQLPIRASISSERHVTTNALDDGLAVRDWYSVLRGTVEGDINHDFGSTKLFADGELRRFDIFGIENDAGAGLGSETTLKVNDALELRGTLSFRHFNEGDALVVEDLAIGTRTKKNTIAAGAAMGLRLTPSLVWTIDFSGFRELANDTVFEDGLVDPFRLEPDRDRLRLQQGLTRTNGPFAYGIRATAERTVVKGLVTDGDIDVDRFALRGELGWQQPGGMALAIAAGGEWLSASFDLIDAIRPSLEATASIPIAGFELRGTILAAFETDDTDDLLASWVRRGQFEIGVPLAKSVAFSSGVFLERRDNLVLGYAEDRRGIFGELGWKTSEHVTLVVRLDYRRDRGAEIDFAKDVVDASIALRANL